MPGQDFSERITYPVETVDIYPTIIDAVGLARPGFEMRGENLFNSMREKSYQYSEDTDRIAIIKGHEKYIIDYKKRKAYFYDLAEDPEELNIKELIFEEAERHFNLKELLEDGVFVQEEE